MKGNIEIWICGIICIAVLAFMLWASLDYVNKMEFDPAMTTQEYSAMVQEREAMRSDFEVER
jgi:hypothetical protein